MKQIYTGKIESATFSNPPENSLIEFLWRDEDQLVANEIAINFSDPEFLAFIEEYPLEKIEKAAKAASKARAKAKEAYDKNVLDEFFKSNPVSIQEKIIEKRIIIEKDIDILAFIEKNNTDKDLVFDLKLKILDEITSTWQGTKNKQLKLKIRKIKTLKNLLGLYYGSF